MTHHQSLWQSIGMLPTMAVHIDAMVASAEEQDKTLQHATVNPHLLNDYEAFRVIEVSTTQQYALWRFDVQLERWKAGSLSELQRTEVDRLVRQMHHVRSIIPSILVLAEELSQRTVEKIVEKNEKWQLGVQALLRALRDEKDRYVPTPP